MKVKICGISTLAAVAAAGRSGADAVGFVFAESPRRVTPREARRLAADLPRGVERVAVFRLATRDDIGRVMDVFDADIVQVEPTPALLGSEFGPRLLPVLHDDGTLAGSSDLLDPARPVLVEGAGRGGRGVLADWERVATVAGRRPVILAGGLHPGNVAEAIRRVRPWGVDVSTGVEDRPGVKSADRMAEFVRAARAADTVEVP